MQRDFAQFRHKHGLARFLLPNGVKQQPEVMIRSKDQLLNRTAAARQTPFTFRRIQARELYQPAAEVEANHRVRFRIRVQALGRAN